MTIKKALWLVGPWLHRPGAGGRGRGDAAAAGFPFLLLAGMSFAKISSRLHEWFISTKMYKDNLESFLQGRGMTKKAKLRVSVTLTLTMGIGFYMMRRVPLGQIILGIVWVCHLLYFIYGIRTSK